MHIIHTNISKGFRGGENQTLLLIQELQKLGIQQTLVCRTEGECGKRAEKLGISLLPINNPVSGHWKILGGDLVHVHDGRSVYWAWLEHLFSRTPYIITRRIPNPISDRSLTHKAYRSAGVLVSVSNECAKALSSQVNRPVQTILDATTQHAIDENLVKQYRTHIGGACVIGHIGALVEHHKGQSVLINAFHLLKKDLPDARLVLVGDGQDKELLMQLADNDPRIIFAGFQNDIGNWIKCFDIFAFPSFEEGLGSSVLDVMALNIPVIAARVGGLPELLKEEKRGTLIASHHPQVWAKTLKRILCYPEAHERQTRAAQQFACNNSPEVMAKQYLEIYQRILHPS